MPCEDFAFLSSNNGVKGEKVREQETRAACGSLSRSVGDIKRTDTHSKRGRAARVKEDVEGARGAGHVDGKEG